MSANKAQCVCDHSVGQHAETGQCVVCGAYCGPVSNEVGQSDLAAWSGMDHETKLNQKLVEAFEVHQKHCQLCGDGKVCATGEALREDAYPQNDSVNGNQELAPERIALHPLTLKTKHGYIYDDPDDFESGDVVYVRADSVSPSVGEVIDDYHARTDHNAVTEVWKALGVTGYTGKAIWEEVQAVVAERDSLRAVVVELEAKAESNLTAIEAAHTAASDESYQELRSWEIRARECEAEGDMYGWNFYKGMEAGRNYTNIMYYRIGREVAKLRAALTKVQAEKNSG